MITIKNDSSYEVALFDAGEEEKFVGPSFGGLRRGRYFVTYRATPFEQLQGHGFYTDDLAAALHRYDVELNRSKNTASAIHRLNKQK